MTHKLNPRRFDPFRVLDTEERRAHLEAYKRHLEERDGRVDVKTRSLSRRESYFLELEKKPVEWEGYVDAEGFYQHLRGTGTPDVDQRILWLSTSAKANLIECYGVEVELEDLFRHPESLEGADPFYLYQMIEEHYHTRILAELCRTYGIEPEHRRPPWAKRLAIHLMVYLPESIRWIPVLTGEALGSQLFKLLLESVDLFSAQPEVEDRLRSLMTEIWVDEVCHAACLRARVGPFGVRIARLLTPLVAWAMMKDLPVLRRLGPTRQAVLAQLRRGLEIPPEMHWMAADQAYAD